MGGEAAIWKLLRFQYVECIFTARVADHARFGEHHQARQDVIMPIAGVVQPEKVGMDYGAIALAPKQSALEENLGGALGS